MRVFSGIRPSGNLHIGNYLGAMKQWLELQEREDCIFCIVDLHAITTPYKPKEIKNDIFKTLITYLSIGLDPKKSIIFLQSDVKEHLELSWFLGTITPLGELKRMTQFKEKAKKHPEYINAGLLNYPVLMAADILLYDTDIVPVGKDQIQHVELTREIARKFNNSFGKLFKLPRPLVLKKSAKIMSLTNPLKKMSKTDNQNSYVQILEEPEKIEEKIMKAVTDSGKEIIYDPKRKPGISNLLNIYSLFSEKPIKVLEKEFKGKNYQFFKKSLSALLIEKLSSFREKAKKLAKDREFLKRVFNFGKKRATKIASKKIKLVKKKMGLLVK